MTIYKKQSWTTNLIIQGGAHKNKREDSARCNTATHALVAQVSTRWGKEVTVWDELVMLH